MSTFFADKLYFLRLFITVHGRELQQKKKNGIDFASEAVVDKIVA